MNKTKSPPRGAHSLWAKAIAVATTVGQAGEGPVPGQVAVTQKGSISPGRVCVAAQPHHKASQTPVGKLLESH